MCISFSIISFNHFSIRLLGLLIPISFLYFRKIIYPSVIWIKNGSSRASLVAQWLRICLPVQGTRVWALVWEDPTCHRATGPVCHNYWACAWGLWATTIEPERLEPVLCNERGRDSERHAHCDEEWPTLGATRENPHTETKTQHSQK